MSSKRIIGYLVTILILVIILIILFSLEDKKTEEQGQVSLALKGESSVSIQVFSNYFEEGVSFTVDDKEIPLDKLKYEKVDNVNYEVIGDYHVIYNIFYKDDVYSIKRNVSIFDDTPPVIKVSNDKVELYTCKKKSKNNLEYVADDNYDGVITDEVKEEILDDKIKLSVTDSSGNITIVEVPYVKTKTPLPSIELNGTRLVYIKKGSTYNDAGIKAYDACGKSIKNEVITKGSVNTEEVGTYTITYELKYEDELISKERKVIVYDYYDRLTNPITNQEKIIYLTFDDGPGRYTKDILNILDKYEAKATFFVTNQFKSYTSLIKEEAMRGHTVAVHTLTHKWNIYSSLENYLKDFNDMDNIIYEQTGKRTKIWRFPGGSSNSISKNYAEGVMSSISSYLSNKGYVVFDWNVDPGDASGANKERVVKNVIAGIKNKKVSVVLMHDIKKATYEGLEEILEYGKNNGYTFLALDETSPTIHHSMRN